MRTAWIVVIILVVLILLYVVYKYMFKQNNTGITSESLISQIPVKPIIRPTPTAVINNDVPSSLSEKLFRMMNCLGYAIQPIKSDNAVSAYVSNKTLGLFEKRFPKTEVIANINNVITSNVITITSNGVTYKLDKEKFTEMQGLGLYNMITYSNKNETQIKAVIDKLNLFWGENYFTDCLNFVEPQTTSNEKAIQTIKEVEEKKQPLVNCDSIAYKQKLTILGIDLQQAKSDLQVADFNLSQFNVQENREKQKRVKERFDKVHKEYLEYYNLCNKK